MAAARLLTLLLLLAAAALAGLLLPDAGAPSAYADTGVNSGLGTVTAIAITSSPANGEFYTVGETITVRVTFTQNICNWLTTKPARLAIQIGDNARSAAPPGAAPGNKNVDFNYTVTAADQDRNGISIAQDALTGEIWHRHIACTSTFLHTITYNSGTDSLPDTLESDQADHKVNDPNLTVRPNTLSALTVRDANSAYAAAADRRYFDLTPAFAASRINYTLSVPNSVSALALDCTRSRAATDTIHATQNCAGSKSLTVGSANSIQITTVPGAGDTDPNKANVTYTITVTRNAADIDYDDDGDGLIDIRTLAQLAAVRWDPDGNGVPGGVRFSSNTNQAGDYDNAFPYPLNPTAASGTTKLGCGPRDHDNDPATDALTTCLGYELRANLDFDTDGDGATYTMAADGTVTGDSGDAYYNGGTGFATIADHEFVNFTAIFEGNGHTISNLFVNGNPADTSSGFTEALGLFGRLGSSAKIGQVRNLGLVNAYVSPGASTSARYVGGVAGYVNSNSTTISGVTTNRGEIHTSYVTGIVRGSGNVGGLAGQLNGYIRASYSHAAVSGNNSVGGLAGRISTGIIYNSYATGPVSGTEDVGALAGISNRPSTAPYRIITHHSYWNLETGCSYIHRLVDGAENTITYGASKTTAQLTAPTGYTGIYANWDDIDVNGDGSNDAPWTFTAGRFPVLNFGGHDTAGQLARQKIDYDCDDDGLIEITRLAQLNAVRYDLDGSGAVDSSANASAYAAADVYPHPAAGMGCPLVGASNPVPTCTGYELGASANSAVVLNFDTDNDDDVDASDSGGSYWNDGQGWLPIGSSTAPYTGALTGNGQTINRLFISRAAIAAGDYSGLLGSATGALDGIKLAHASVAGRNYVGGVAGSASGAVSNAAVAGSVSGTGYVGGVAGAIASGGSIATATSSATVVASGDRAGGIAGAAAGAVSSATATGNVSGVNRIGGLVGDQTGGSVSASSATGTAAGTGDRVGGLIGAGAVLITASKATGSAAGVNYVGGLVGEQTAGGNILTASATGTATGTGDRVGGLVGATGGNIYNAWASGNVSGVNYVGGLVGDMITTPVSGGHTIYPTISVAYALGTVTGTDRVGGLIGHRHGTMSIAYALGAVTGTTNAGGMAGAYTSASRPVTSAHYDTETTGQTTSPGGGASQTSRALVEPTDYAAGAIYAQWNVHFQGDAADDDPWDFGTNRQYPVLKQGHDVAAQQALQPALPTDSALSGLTAGTLTLNETFAAGATSYTADAASSVTQVTVAGTPRRSLSTVTYSGTDADTNAPGHQLALSAGANTVTITVTAAAGSPPATTAYTLVITREAGLLYSITGPAADTALDEDGNLAARTLTINITGSRAPSAAGNVLCTITPNTANSRTGTDASDFTATPGLTATAAFTASGVGTDTASTCVFYVAEDNDTEPAEHFTVTLSSPTAGAVPSANYGVAASRNFSISASDPISDNDDLSGLTLTEGSTGTGTAITLTPAFSASRLTYAAEVGNAVSQITVAPTADNSGASIAYSTTDAAGTTTTADANTDATAPGHQVDLVAGSNIITVTVTAPDGMTTQNYVITVYRLGGNNTLRNLTVRGSDGVYYALTPAFRPGVTAYAAAVPRPVTRATINLTPTAAGASLSVTGVNDGVYAPLGIHSHADRNLGIGSNVIRIQLLPSGGGVATYTVTITRQSAFDYDANDNGLIDIRTLAQLDAVRYDLDGNGVPSLADLPTHDPDSTAEQRAAARAEALTDAQNAYNAAFPGRVTAANGLMGCPDGDDADSDAGDCIGYELLNSLDFDTDEDGSTWTRSADGTIAADADDAYYDNGVGWTPIAAHGDTFSYTAIFQGNGHTIANLFVNNTNSLHRSGLFGQVGYANTDGTCIGSVARIEGVGLVNAYITSVSNDVGGLVGFLDGNGIANAPTFDPCGYVIASYVTGHITGTTYAGGLVARSKGTIRASYSLAAVRGNNDVGGLVGLLQQGDVHDSYAAGPVTGDIPDIHDADHNGGLIGLDSTTGRGDPVHNSYYDRDAGCQHHRTRQVSDTRAILITLYGEDKTTAQLMAPAGYTGIYAAWDDYNLDDDTATGAETTGADSPWTFQTGPLPGPQLEKLQHRRPVRRPKD